MILTEEKEKHNLMLCSEMFEALTKKRDDSQALIQCMEDTVIKLLEKNTSSNNPGILLGKIQSGKTRAFIGIMALAFDNDYDASIILTKGTKALVKQTVQRMEKDFSDFIQDDRAEVFDIMFMPDNLTKYERDKKLIIVVKKEVNNMRRILEKLANIYPDLRDKKILVIDDEADYASISFRKHAEAVEMGRISSQIDELRNIVKEVDYLQVTATPYSLYLQPTLAEDDIEFLPKRPSFTALLPEHEGYVGGQFYFDESDGEDSIAFNIYEEVSVEERDILKKQDARRFKLEDVLVSDKISSLRKAIMNFIVGASIRRLQQSSQGEKPQKYAFVAHSEISKASHKWQAEIIEALIFRLAEAAKKKESVIYGLIRDSYDDISLSVQKLPNTHLPSLSDIQEYVKGALLEEHIMTTVVNSDKQVEELLDNEGQLKLRNPMNIFIGGQILDRGITIDKLIGFYYGRNPKRFQQDTVLQHSRMYGARPKEDLAVTRFYTTRDIYEVMKRIYEFDSVLRDTFEKGGNNQGIYFIRKDVTGKLVACSPNKLLLSSIATLRPYRRVLPAGFQTGYKSHIEATIKKIDFLINQWFEGTDKNEPIMIDLSDAIEVTDLIEKTLILDDLYPWNWNTFKASLEHLSIRSKKPDEQGKVWLVIREGKNLSRTKENGRFSDDPDGGSGRTARTVAREIAVNTPCLMLIKENGEENNGWRNTPFWWPILMNPERTEASIFAEDTV